ncbi:MAG: hypothetical protein AAF738_06950, partial [Bacteroidota bacterium]
MKQRLYSFLCILYCCISWHSGAVVYAQDRIESTTLQLVNAIEGEIELGEKRAIRDLATLIERPEAKATILEILQQHTLFTSREININRYTSKQQLLDFYYENEDHIQYSELLQVFYITPLDERTSYYTLQAAINDEETDAVVRLRQHIRRYEQYVATEDYNSAASQIQRIAQLDVSEGYEYLLGVLAKRPFKRRSKAARLYQDLCKGLTSYYEP